VLSADADLERRANSRPLVHGDLHHWPTALAIDGLEGVDRQDLFSTYLSKKAPFRRPSRLKPKVIWVKSLVAGS